MESGEESEAKAFELLQCIGGDSSGPVDDEDLITSIDYDQTGKHLAVGDKMGRLIIFKKAEATTAENQEKAESRKSFKFLTEFKAQNDDFDVLRSQRIDPGDRCHEMGPLARQKPEPADRI